MIEKICKWITKRIRKEMPEIDDERAEIIEYGLQMIIGELPKIGLVFIMGYLLGVGNLTLFTFLVILPYRTFSGGFHLKTHIGCLIGSTVFFCLNPIICRYIFISETVKKIAIAVVWIYSMVMIKLYAPADTENVPIIYKPQRKKQEILSYITMTLTLIVAFFIPTCIYSNIIILAVITQSLSISRIMYKLTNNKYGYEVYDEEGNLIAE